MNDHVALLFGVHAHQPAGNFSEVVDLAHERCYRPFLQTMADYPGFRFAVHFSGPLLDQLAAQYPDDIDLLARMVARGQVELFGAGDAEPVLAAIPQRDRITQIAALSGKLSARFGARPRGAWLTERVWESSVVPALVDCGIRYATVDDYHFLCAGRDAATLDRYFTTEEDGRTLDIFPISEALRYRIPFAPARDAVAYLENLPRRGTTPAAVYFDDIEKLGVWPETHEWVYGRRWLRDFVEGVLASPRIRTMRYADYHSSERTGGIVYLPTTSYIEMNEWTLPAPAAAEYAALVGAEKEAGRYDARKGFLRGGIWRNFMSRYPEANWMHKRMLALSARLAALPDARQAAALRPHLHLAQANDAYWHGLFGGLYLPHLRRGVYAQLLRLEAGLQAIAPRPAVERTDLDCDGVDELFVRSPELAIVLRVDGTAAVRELSDYRLAQNFGDTLRRHAEFYHRRVVAGAAAAHAGEGIASAHDRTSFKHAIAAADAAPDASPRDLFRDTWVAEDGAAVAVDGYAFQGAPAPGAPVSFLGAVVGMHVAKTVVLEGSTVSVRYRLEGARKGAWRTTLDFAMPSCDGVGGRYVVDGEIRGGFGQPLDVALAPEIVLDDRHMGGSVAVSASPPARFTGRPYLTVSQSEEGFERIMQSATIVVEWTVEGGAAEFALRLAVTADGR